MKHVVLLVVLFCSLFSLRSSAETITFGEDLTVEVPDSMQRLDPKGRALLMSDGNLVFAVDYVKHEGHDIGKIKALGDTILYPFLKEAVLTSEETEKWHDWTHDYVKRTYVSGDSTVAYTYHIDANKAHYIFAFSPLTEEGKAMANEMMDKGISNNSWFNNAPWWWGTLFGLLIFAAMIIMGEDDRYDFSTHLKGALILLLVFSIIALLVTHFNIHWFWKAVLVALVIVVVVPPFRKQVGYILENADM